MSRARRRDLKEGRIFICATDGGSAHPTHSCRKGDPVVIDWVFKPGAMYDAKIPVACAATFIPYWSNEPVSNSFRLCDLRKPTREEWGI